MSSLIAKMQAAQQRSQPPSQVTQPTQPPLPTAIKPGSVMALLYGKPKTAADEHFGLTPQLGQLGQQSHPGQQSQPPSTQHHRPHVICGATPCTNCGSSWIVETYGLGIDGQGQDYDRAQGQTLCHGCLRPRAATFDYSEPALTAKAVTGQRSSLTNAQFIDAVTKAGYPKLAELVTKYQGKNEGKKNED